MSVEEFLKSLPEIHIYGGSPLWQGVVHPYGISINGFHPGYAAAVNLSKADYKRTLSWERVLSPADGEYPWPDAWRGAEANRVVMTPSQTYDSYFPVLHGKQPTTVFRLLRICDYLKLPSHLYGVDGYASKWHDGDWEMHIIKTQFPFTTVHDPRPAW